MAKGLLAHMLRSMFGGPTRSAVSAVESAQDVPPSQDAAPSSGASNKVYYWPPSYVFPQLNWPVETAEQVGALLEPISKKLVPGVFLADNLMAWGRSLSMLEDAAFLQAWQANAESAADHGIVWRRHVLASAAYQCQFLDGDFVECGAYTGVGVKTVVDYLGGPDFPKTFWAYDVFEHDESMANHSMPEHGPGLYEKVCKKFVDYPRVKIMRGLIPGVFAEGCPERIAYLHIDLNQAPAEIAALDALFDRMVPGGMLILDDYDWGGVYREQKLAEDAWFAERNYRVMALPTGQGLIIKR